MPDITYFPKVTEDVSNDHRTEVVLQTTTDCEGDTDMSYGDEPHTPTGREITGEIIENNANRTPPTALAALIISPGSLPAKRLYSDAWKEPEPFSGHEPRSLSKVRLSFSSRDVATNKDVAMIGAKFDSQADKKQKLEGGRLQQILYMKDRLPRLKNPPTLTVPHEFHLRTEERARDPVKSSPFVSMAERVRRFHTRTPERYHIPPHNSEFQPKEHEHDTELKLTRAKSPAFETSHRVRPLRVKSAEELEEEMLAKVPKFKARPLPKKILEAPAMPTFSRSTPHVQEFQEFHLHTMERAQHYASSLSSSSTDSQSPPSNSSKQLRRDQLLKAHPPHLETANRARPSTLKSWEELEEEELAKMPKFKALPINKTIFESKGEPRNHRREVTVPQEFHLRTDERAHSRNPANLTNQIVKLSLNKPEKEAATLRPTIPKPFHLATDDRGLAKEMRHVQERIQQQQEEAKARIPVAHPLPSTTEIPEVFSKPPPKECTMPEPFRLQSAMLHEQKKQERLMHQQMQAEQLAAALREYHAKPVPSKTSATLPPRPRKPLTVIEEFNLLVDKRAVERQEFDKKVAEKQTQYNLHREKYEAERQAEEEKFLKAMRKEMVPTARPMPKFPPPSILLRSTKELTTPVSPHFLKKTSMLMER